VPGARSGWALRRQAAFFLLISEALSLSARTALDASHSRLQTEICAFSDAAAEFEKHNCVVRTLLRL
jgi:hypothetical protein